MANVDLTSSTVNLVVLANEIKQNGIDQGDLVKAIYNLVLAVHTICNNLDVDSGTLGTDYLACVGTPLATALKDLVPKPPGNTTAA